MTPQQSGEATDNVGARQVVVVGIDGSDHSQRALRWAVSYGAGRGVDVRAIAVWHVHAQYGAPAAIMPPVDLEAEAAQLVHQAVTETAVGPGVVVHSQVLEGAAAEVLVDASRDATLLVVGNKGRGALAGALTGSVALKCAHHAECPVVLVP